MLHVYFGEMDGIIYNTEVYFKNVYEDEWIVDSFNREMIRDVDSSEVLASGVIDSPVLGKIPPERLSGGVKTLILIRELPDKVFYASACGDNCAPWLLRIAEHEDRTVNLRHIMDFGMGQFDIHILNTDQVVHTMRELVPVAGMLV
ncbi:MAG TPA: DUF4869 domain-containing protein [Selenomonas sp.]|nr:DUF4869 domain-containing protein [Selenomonadaceae bacterium]HBT78997.1 DUF4869 domain-containing protein [Selenomonas sp.]